MSARSVEAWLALARWGNALLAGAGVLVGAWWAGWDRRPPGAPIALTTAAALLLAAAANAWNDRADLELDRLAHPERPLPRGVISPEAAARFAAACAALALAFVAFVSLALAALTIGVLLLMRAYSPWLKRIGLPGNIVVAILASLPFLYGGWSVGRPGAALALVLVAAPLHLARELAKDLDDATADAVGRRRTLPLRAGARAAGGLVVALTAIFCLALLPFVASRPLLGAAVLPGAALAVSGAARAWRGERGSPLVFKLAMVCAMAAFVVGRR